MQLLTLSSATSTLTFCDGRSLHRKQEVSTKKKTSHSTPYRHHNQGNCVTRTVTPIVTTQVTKYETYVGASEVVLPPTYLASPTPAEDIYYDDTWSIGLSLEFPIGYRNITWGERDEVNGPTFQVSISDHGVSP